MPIQSDLDARLIGLEPISDDGTASRFTLAPHLCRPDGVLFGGAALSASLTAMELATGRLALWATVQFVASASTGEQIESHVELLARGKYIDQVRITATTGDRLIYTALGSAATRRDDGIRGSGPCMPDVAPPADTPNFGASRGWSDHGELGHHRVSEFHEAERLDGGGGPGHMTMWARLSGETTTTAAKLGFLADMVPVAICRAAGVTGAGTSLDNSLRLGRLVDTEWVLLDHEGHVAEGGYGHGIVHLWSPDGELMATGSQTAKLFSIDSFRQRRRRLIAVRTVSDTAGPGSRASSRNALIDAALDEFSELGYERATVAGIAERAGVTTGALYAHFDGKLDLLIEAIGLARPSAYVQDLIRTFSMSVGEVAESISRSTAQRPDRHMLLLLDVIVVARRDPEVAATLRRGFEAYVATIQKATEDGIAAGLIDPVLEPPDLARVGAIISLGSIVLEALDEDPPRPTALAHLTDLLLQSHRGERRGEAPALSRVRSRAAVAERAEGRLHAVIADAAADGHSLRQIGHAAGVSHERVRRILAGNTATTAGGTKR